MPCAVCRVPCAVCQDSAPQRLSIRWCYFTQHGGAEKRAYVRGVLRGFPPVLAAARRADDGVGGTRHNGTGEKKHNKKKKEVGERLRR